ncbi:hypothetical protein DFH06DRAFT_1125571 [Mycena polygramma]|nr:hypothetical protein DFH06DRAFT_1125571 [Mycena polygramma]
MIVSAASCFTLRGRESDKACRLTFGISNRLNGRRHCGLESLKPNVNLCTEGGKWKTSGTRSNNSLKPIGKPIETPMLIEMLRRRRIGRRIGTQSYIQQYKGREGEGTHAEADWEADADWEAEADAEADADVDADARMDALTEADLSAKRTVTSTPKIRAPAVTSTAAPTPFASNWRSTSTARDASGLQQRGKGGEHAARIERFEEERRDDSTSGDHSTANAKTAAAQMQECKKQQRKEKKHAKWQDRN